ncbi:metalloproteinase-like isoform 6 [Dinothrombium tinctorium]|uniref:Metalloproteinase-like isoform 6 n=1 Tax=Dinothrombium tinctorium TaxID=1965070 RepID=A0A443RIM3_9ACAR|nr:metalloproteinase-like isoform 6 [Dinothrombium tinctorium]RWS15105.1 metalloproteinase-like isoform 6 [Dinothrombium tinctorium]
MDCIDFDCKTLRLTFTAFNEKFDFLLLKRKKHFLESRIDDLTDECHFLTKTKQEEYEALNVCKTQLNGFFFKNGFYYKANTEKQQETYTLTRYKSLEEANQFCGRHENASDEDAISGRDYLFNRKLYALKHVPVLFVVDYLTYAQSQKDKSKIENFIREGMIYANKLYYSSLNVNVSVANIEFWSSGDEITISHKAAQTLRNFRFYNEKILKPLYYKCYRHSHLITSVRLEERTLGLAYVGTICGRDGFASVSISSIRGQTARQFIQTFIHELGHNFGLMHDTHKCFCLDGVNKCIMRAIADGYPASHWSQCSLSSFYNNQQNGLHQCLQIEPPDECPRIERELGSNSSTS